MGSNDISEQRVIRALKSAKQLGTLVGIAQRVREITANQQASIKELVHVISSDAVMTTKVLRLVNSAAYGFSGRIANIDQAIVILGFRQLRDLCVGLALIKDMGLESRCDGFRRADVWKHSLGTAVACRLIQERVGGGQSSDLFVAGLLCNIGRVVLDQFFPDDFMQVFSFAQERHLPLIEAERHVLNTTHAEIGYWAALVWGLNEKLAGSIRDHHGPSGNRSADIINLAYVITQVRGVGCPGDPILTMLSPGVLESLKIDKPFLDSILRDLDGEYQSIEPLLKIMRE